MTRDLALDDPEVRADLALRERTARERSDRRGPAGLDRGQDPDGLSPALARLYDSVPAPVVEHWPCRGGCGTMVGVPREGIEEFDAMNARLRAMRQAPVPKTQVMACPNCLRAEDAARQAQRRPHQQRQIPGLQRPMQAGKGTR